MPSGEAPAWVYVLTALSVVAYVNLDCMDGKQARRTGSSSPLGQVSRHAFQVGSGAERGLGYAVLARLTSRVNAKFGWGVWK